MNPETKEVHFEDAIECAEWSRAPLVCIAGDFTSTPTCYPRRPVIIFRTDELLVYNIHSIVRWVNH